MKNICQNSFSVGWDWSPGQENAVHATIVFGAAMFQDVELEYSQREGHILSSPGLKTNVRNFSVEENLNLDVNTDELNVCLQNCLFE